MGVIGGVANEAVGLMGTAATLSSTATQMKLSPTRNAEVGQAVAGALASGAEATFQYGQSVATNPGRLSGDAEAVWQGGVDLGERVVNHYETAIAEGRGSGAFGMTSGQVLTNVIPIGAGPNVAREGATGALRLTAREGAEALAREGLETVASRTRASIDELRVVVDAGRGNRPNPSDYLSPQRISEHRAAFEDGASQFTLQSTIDKYGLGQRDGTSFVMARSEANQIIASSGRDLRRLEEALGLPKGQLNKASLVRVDFNFGAMDDLNVRIPGGIEAGANDSWMPGGYLPSGANEAVLDGRSAMPNHYNITPAK